MSEDKFLIELDLCANALYNQITSIQQPSEIIPIIIPILKMKKLRFQGPEFAGVSKQQLIQQIRGKLRH